MGTWIYPFSAESSRFFYFSSLYSARKMVTGEKVGGQFSRRSFEAIESDRGITLAVPLSRRVFTNTNLCTILIGAQNSKKILLAYHRSDSREELVLACLRRSPGYILIFRHGQQRNSFNNLCTFAAICQSHSRRAH